ncbi:MAG: DUF1684 domain-containing protein [Melioribacteraceae bacterium]|nr:DUF1684 domain-containing protein [Melioribacteraceae bacterium]MCF8265496.1 DUF1684 domain-containing protein [Melioribacteraceae bacterium]MCF8432055.1 DUF1684 domain-containing protein [Melioribacteraceae bacterium]
MKISKILFYVSFSLLILLQFIGCEEKYTTEQQLYVEELNQIRTETNEYMAQNPNSPFNAKGKIDFHNLNYFDANFDFIFRSKLYENAVKDTLVIMGTKGEQRQSIRFGYLLLDIDDEQLKLNVYKSQSQDGEVYYSIWFTDKTTGEESYGVGRYLNFELNEDPDFIYTIDFNLAYNPYCAYSKDYSCAIPTKEDFIDAEITAGEKIFHD